MREKIFDVNIRTYKDKDAEPISRLIVRNFLEVNSKDYGIEAMRELAQSHDEIGRAHV